ncbi:MAG: insulinase family protein, partial [Gammaproteobacteria bacterium]|nr:insulinase family protein [Gammaproteobacteria bacterium]
MEDLNAASLEDVHEWFTTYYGAANTVLVVAGAINTEEVIKKVEHYFGNIPSGPPVTRHQSWTARLTGIHKQISYDHVSQTMLLKSWNIPGNMSKETNLLSLVGDILSSGKSSRLYKRLVYDEQLATSVQAYISAGEIAGTFEISARIKPGVEEEKVNQILEEELARFLKEGPTEQELAKTKVQVYSGFVRGLEKIGGFGGKSDILAANYVYTGDPHYYKKELDWIKNASREEIRKIANEWLSDGQYHLEVRPFEDYQINPEGADRSMVPEPSTPPQTTFDPYEKASLENGLTILLAKRDAIPVVLMQLTIDAGYASDQFSSPGVASLAMDMLDEGTRKRDSLQINEELILAGASIQSGSNLDTSFVSLSSLKSTLENSLDIFSDVIMNPSFPEKEFDRLKDMQINRIKNEQKNPSLITGRILPKLIYGPGHAYSNPMSGSGTTDSVKNITLNDLKSFHQTWFKPNNATLIVVGDLEMEDLVRRISGLFSSWKAEAVPAKNIGDIQQTSRVQVYLVDKSGAPQTQIMGAMLATPKSDPDEAANIIMNNIIGGNFGSRINMNLREDKHWSYGSFSGFVNARGQRIFYVATGVQTDKTVESMQEIRKELTNYINSHPATAEEIRSNTESEILSLTGRWESASSVLRSLSEIVQYDLPDDYFQHYAGEIAGLSQEDITRSARNIILPDRMVWLLVGDREKILAELTSAGFGAVTLL